jgi:hypothetical protein
VASYFAARIRPDDTDVLRQLPKIATILGDRGMALVAETIAATIVAAGSDTTMLTTFKTKGPAAFEKQYPQLTSALTGHFSSKRTRLTRKWAARGDRYAVPRRVERDAEMLVKRLPFLMLLHIKMRMLTRSFWRLKRRRVRKACGAILAAFGSLRRRGSANHL